MGANAAKGSSVSFRPIYGVHRGAPAQLLQPGFSPNAQNVVDENGFMKPRSGMSMLGTGKSHLSAAALGAWRVHDLGGVQHGVAASDRTITFLAGDQTSWSTLSYQKPSTATNLPSGTSRDYWDASVVYEPGVDKNIAVLCNGVNLPKVITLNGSVTTYSDLTGFASLASNAKSVTAFDNRLVFFNVGVISPSVATYGQRVMWSPRGAPLNYALASGAGFEDLLDMQGIGVKVIAERDSILLFTEDEIWRGRKRFDAYVFDFYPVERQFGCPYERTICKTPKGTIFLGRDQEFYIVAGDNVLPIGPAEEGGESRVQELLRNTMFDVERAWGIYNTTARRYEFYYATTEGGHADRGLYYTLQEGSWWPQTFPFQVSAGFEMRDPGDPGPTWDSVSVDATWDGSSYEWNNVATPGTDYLTHVVSSNGTVYQFRANQTSDAGTAISAFWDSHYMNRADAMRYDTLHEVFVEHNAPSTSAMSVSLSADGGAYFEDAQRVTMSGGYGRALVPFYRSGGAMQLRLNADSQAFKVSRIEARFRDGGLYGS